MKILMLSTDYPSEKSKKLMYIHTRNLYYKKQGNDVIVLNFNSKYNSIKKEFDKNDKYFYQNTTSQEFRVFEKVLGEIK